MNTIDPLQLFKIWNMKPHDPLGLIFDVDDLLCHNRRHICLAYNMLLEQRGLSPEEGEMFPGKDLFDIAANIRSKYSLSSSVADLVMERREHYLRLINESDVTCCKGVKQLFQFLEHLKSTVDLRIAYASSSEIAFVRPLLSKIFDQCDLYSYVHNPDTFFYCKDGHYASTCWEQGMKKKPVSDVYDVTLRGLNLQSHQCIAFEDSLSGFQSARSADIRVVVIPSETGNDHFDTFEFDVIHDAYVKLHSLLEFYWLLQAFYEDDIPKV